jgi:hypothetical protein
MTRYLYSSVTRIAAFPDRDFAVAPVPRDQWATGDYVVGEVQDTSGVHTIELPNGRMLEAMEGDRIVGAFGARAATLEAVGSWREIEGERFQALTSAGLFGRLVSASPFLPELMSLSYVGHVQVDGRRASMQDSAGTAPAAALQAPIILITGTSMSSGKTMSGRLIVHLLTAAGLRVVGAKLTGAARYRDVLSYGDAGAAAVFDFVDAGLPSTVCAPEDYRAALSDLLGRIGAAEPDVVVAEAGASPLEPYNGKTAMDFLGDRVRFTLLCASDPYAVLGVARAFAKQPDLVAGGAANTTAGIALVKELTGLPAMNLIDSRAREPLLRLLRNALAL